ncbi:hypothetical protein [Emticicia sp.]|uniref:hypothetical protein n=1 Tax=Emticicia sp. TaxID=1930953 RepID=UPI003751F401
MINSQFDELHKLADCQNESHYLRRSPREAQNNKENSIFSAALDFARATEENVLTTEKDLEK